MSQATAPAARHVGTVGDPSVTRRARIDWFGDVVLVVVAGAWAVVLALTLRHQIFVSHDTVISYAHVWYVSDRFWHGHGLPIRMPQLGHGDAFAFPYGFVPWSTAALLRPLFGDWIVTLWLVLGCVGVAAATFWAFPELRRGWLAAAVLLNPALVTGFMIGQLPFLWAAALFIAAMGAWRRKWTAAAIVLTALAQITHPAVMLPIVLAVVIGRLAWEPRPRRLLGAYALSLLPALPAAWIVWRSPVFVESSFATRFGQFVGTLGPRALLVAIPIALVLLRDRLHQWAGPTLIVVLLAANFVMGRPMGMAYAWGALDRQPNAELVGFLESPDFVPGATYRLLRTDDGRIGFYQLLRHGGRLDSEFFPESMKLNSWSGKQAYSAELVRRHVDFVIAFHSYDRNWQTNEHMLLEQLTRASPVACSHGLVTTRVVTRRSQFDVYAVDHGCASRRYGP